MSCGEKKVHYLDPPSPAPPALSGGLALRRHAAERADVAVAGELILHEHHVEEQAVLSPSLARRLEDRSEMRKRYAGGMRERWRGGGRLLLKAITETWRQESRRRAGGRGRPLADEHHHGPCSHTSVYATMHSSYS